jgi:hypothetical protein
VRCGAVEADTAQTAVYVESVADALATSSVLARNWTILVEAPVICASP